ncbi:MAG: PEP-CTERM sorting domain-containing protein [Acidobacteria bacterium]|nr:PEP-CTERM sorting domain-containing protein [Acidobacteriota bacterium]
MSRKLLTLSLLVGTSALAANIVTDGTFEAGGAAWTTSGAASIINSANCHNGSSFCAQYGPSPLGNVHQFVPTVTGATYTVSFWLRSISQSTAPPDNAFHFQWDNLIPLVTQVNNAGAFDWTLFTTDVVATSNSMWLSFQGANNTGTFLLDDITVEGPDGSVPEPSTLLLTAAGASLLFLRSRKTAKT